MLKNPESCFLVIASANASAGTFYGIQEGATMNVLDLLNGLSNFTRGVVGGNEVERVI